MKGLIGLVVMTILSACQAVVPRADSLEYAPNDQFPYGRANPDAPAETTQFEFMIGKNDCIEQRLNNATGKWEDATRTWDGYYYMNGYAIRDEGRSSTTTNGNIRIFDALAEEWVVTFFSSPAYSSGTWRGTMEEDKLVLRQPQKAPGTDFDGFSTLTFSHISEKGFNWAGEWISEDGSVVFPFWKIQCRKVAPN